MGSKSRDVRLRQKELAEKALDARLAVLAEREVEGKTVDRDSVVRRLRADVAKSKKRIAAIDAQEKLNKKLAERKEAKKNPRKDKTSGKKKAQKAGEGKGKKKAKKKPKS